MGDNDNVTVAVLKNEVGHLSERIDEKVGGLDIKIDRLTDKVENGLKRSGEVEKCIVALNTNLDNLDEKVDNMDNRYKKINIATAAGAAIGTGFATVLAIFGIRQ